MSEFSLCDFERLSNRSLNHAHCKKSVNIRQDAPSELTSQLSLLQGAALVACLLLNKFVLIFYTFQEITSRKYKVSFKLSISANAELILRKD